MELRLTPAGHAIAGELLPLVVDQTNAALAPLSKKEFAQLRDYLVRLLDHAQSAETAAKSSIPRGRAVAKSSIKLRATTSRQPRLASRRPSR